MIINVLHRHYEYESKKVGCARLAIVRDVINETVIL